jgi:hypothetical protein
MSLADMIQQIVNQSQSRGQQSTSSAVPAPSPPDFGYGARWDEKTQSYSGPPKGLGFLGPLKNARGEVMSEYSVDGEINGKPVQYPSIVPTLTKDELTAVLSAKEGARLPNSVYQKAAAFAKQRLDAGQDPFAAVGEQQNLYPELERAPVPSVAVK